MTADAGFFHQPTRRKTMKEEKTHPKGKEDSQDEGQATPVATAPTDTKSDTDDVIAFSEPPDPSGGGK